jgi:hypothetical protein
VRLHSIDFKLDAVGWVMFSPAFFLPNLSIKGVIPMICTTIKEGMECPFMSANGCSYNGGICHQVVEQCQGCNRGAEYTSGWYCSACPEPAMKWKNGSCNLASHVSSAGAATKAKINPLKASKRARR